MPIIGASLYIVLCSARNRVRMRLRRLREPRYLLGGIAGAAYLYFSFFARLRTARAGQRRRGAVSTPIALASVMRGGAAGLVGLLLFAVTVVAWILPFESGLLAFSDAEIHFLFPAPVSRRALLLHRMIRSQIGLLFGGAIIGIAMPSVTGYARLRTAIAMWLLLSTGKVYFTGISLARAKLASRDARARQAAWLPLGILAAASAVVVASIYRAVSAAAASSMREAFERIAAATGAGAAGIVLWPFTALARPIFAVGVGDYLLALGVSALVLVATTAWMLQIDAAVEEAAAAAERRAADAASQTSAYRASRASFTLAAFGRPEAIFAWKAATQTLRSVDRRNLFRLAAIIVALTVAATSLGRASGVRALGGSFALAATAFLILMAPQVLRVDMREDLRHLDVLKTWPVRAAAIVRGELVWPGAILTAGAWAALTIAEILAGTSLFARVQLAWRLAGGAAIAILAPALVFAQLTIHNAAALLFPAWVPLGQQRPRGLDAMGQRLIMLGATWLLLVISVIPGAVAGAIVWLALRAFVGAAAIVPAALVCAAAVAAEVLVATEALGPAYESLDLTAVERAE